MNHLELDDLEAKSSKSVFVKETKKYRTRSDKRRNYNPRKDEQYVMRCMSLGGFPRGYSRDEARRP
jgi:hypothetical protein